MIYNRILTRIVVYCIYAISLLLYALFQGSEYDWMDTGSLADGRVTLGDDGSSKRIW